MSASSKASSMRIFRKLIELPTKGSEFSVSYLSWPIYGLICTRLKIQQKLLVLERYREYCLGMPTFVDSMSSWGIKEVINLTRWGKTQSI